jgi:hypothetical protein
VDFTDIFLQKKKGRAGRAVKPCAISGFWIKEALLCLVKGAGGSLARKAHVHHRLEKWFSKHYKIHNQILRRKLQASVRYKLVRSSNLEGSGSFSLLAVGNAWTFWYRYENSRGI